jgi:MoxR-like ATPase
MSSLPEDVSKLQGRFTTLKAEVGKVLVGQDEMLHRLLLGLIAGGHVLLEGVPGLAKTLVIRTLASALDGTFSRIQFTPDMLPGDVIGTQIYNPREGTYSIKKGPVFGNFILADEINRAPAKVQSALLEAMQEKQVTLGDQTLKLAEPFLVLATQNPIEQEGTYPLPEAQLDRFLFDIRVGYPKEDEEIAILRSTTGAKGEALGAILGASELIALQGLTRDVTAADSVLRYAAALVRATRPDDGRAPELVKRYVRWGAGPRAGQSLILGAKAHALLAGRLSVSPNDVKRVALPVLRHRVLPNFAAEAEGVAVERIIDDLLVRIDPPRSDIHV